MQATQNPITGLIGMLLAGVIVIFLLSIVVWIVIVLLSIVVLVVDQLHRWSMRGLTQPTTNTEPQQLPTTTVLPTDCNTPTPQTPPIDRQLLRQRAKLLHRIQHGPFHPDLKYMLSCIDHQIACHPRGGFRKGSGLHHDSHF